MTAYYKLSKDLCKLMNEINDFAAFYGHRWHVEYFIVDFSVLNHFYQTEQIQSAELEIGISIVNR